MLEDRSGSQGSSFLTQNLNKFMEAARQRREIAGILTTYLPSVPQVFVKVDRDKVLKLGVSLNDVYTTLQTFMGGNFVNYFNRFGRVWQVYLEAEDTYRARAENLLQFYVRNKQGQPVPLSAFTEIVRPMFILIQRLATKNANLRRTRDLLLPRLLSGQVELNTQSA